MIDAADAPTDKNDNFVKKAFRIAVIGGIGSGRTLILDRWTKLQSSRKYTGTPSDDSIMVYSKLMIQQNSLSNSQKINNHGERIASPLEICTVEILDVPFNALNQQVLARYKVNGAIIVINTADIKSYAVMRKLRGSFVGCLTMLVANNTNGNAMLSHDDVEEAASANLIDIGFSTELESDDTDFIELMIKSFIDENLLSCKRVFRDLLSSIHR